MLQHAVAWQPGGQEYLVCLNMWPYALAGTKVKITKETVHGALCDVAT